MDLLRRWSLRHARLLSRMYQGFKASAPRIAPLLRWLPADRLDRLVRPVVQAVKRAFFDCQMCGQCGLSVTGMACPMGCAKGMRNGPCGGVRADGHYEVHLSAAAPGSTRRKAACSQSPCVVPRWTPCGQCVP